MAGGGYIWHTTGSGKTLTSFKTARLASNLPYIDKVLFVVDRKDLDYQTMKEYDRFEKGAANSNTSTAILKKQLEKDECRIIITTIQKLSTFIKKNPAHDVYQKHVIIIFDECHRSQFGDMHPFTAFATNTQLDAIKGAFSADDAIRFRRLYNECCVTAASTGTTPYDILHENRPDLDANLFFDMASNSLKLFKNLTALYGELYLDFIYSKRKIGALADQFRALPKADAEHMMPIAFETLPKVATETKTQFVKAEFSGRNKSQKHVLKNRMAFLM